jgi:hypothetical protein
MVHCNHLQPDLRLVGSSGIPVEERSNRLGSIYRSSRIKMAWNHRSWSSREVVSVLEDVNRLQFGLGLLVVLVAASLLLLDVIESGIAIAIGLLGIILLATSGRRRG